jgi:prepilin-type N-terminal cleavage/methylation domain-containing protein
MNLSKIKDFKSSKGFTLIELLIVIAIIGILAAALLVAINPAQKIASANNARVKEDLANIGNAANLFSTDTALRGCTGSYPTAWNQSYNTGCPNGITVSFMAQPKDPRNAGYTAVFNGTVGFAVWGTAYTDLTANPPVAAGSVWCWQTSTGQVTYYAASGSCVAN